MKPHSACHNSTVYRPKRTQGTGTRLQTYITISRAVSHRLVCFGTDLLSTLAWLVSHSLMRAKPLGPQRQNPFMGFSIIPPHWEAGHGTAIMATAREGGWQPMGNIPLSLPGLDIVNLLNDLEYILGEDLLNGALRLFKHHSPDTSVQHL